jgi:hypothetical protein
MEGMLKSPTQENLRTTNKPKAIVLIIYVCYTEAQQLSVAPGSRATQNRDARMTYRKN